MFQLPWRVSRRLISCVVFGLALLSGLATPARAQVPAITAITAPRQVVTIGQNLTLSVTATGATSYQWKRNGRPIPGATAASHTISGAKPARDNGWYQVTVTNGSGSTTSAVVFIIVRPVTSQIVGWGFNGSSQLDIPAGLTDIVRVVAGNFFAVALKADGSVVSWTFGYTVPGGLSGVVDIAAGQGHVLALKSDGTVVAWGESFWGATSVPVGLSNVVAIAAGYDHSLALRADGTVVAWGSGEGGGTSVPAGLSAVGAIAAGYHYSLALRTDGSVVGWGDNSNGQSSVASGVSSVAKIAAGLYHGLALRSDGTAVGWRSGVYGADVPAGLSGLSAIAGGYGFSLAVREDGTIAGWGNNTSGILDWPAGMGNVVDVAASSGFSVSAFALREAAADTLPAVTVQPVAKAAFAGQDVTLSVTASGGTALLSYQWRRNGVALAGATGRVLALPRIGATEAGNYDVVVTDWLGSVTSTSVAVTVNTSPAITLNLSGQQVVAPGQNLTLSATTALAGPVTYQWRRNAQPIAGATAATLNITGATWRDAGAYQLVVTNSVGPVISDPIFVSVGLSTQLLGFGDSSNGELNLPTGLTNVMAVAAASNHSLVLRSDGTVLAWGYNASGQVNVPAGLNSVVAIAAGETHSMALRSNGTVTTWGGINFTPAGLSNVIAIAAGVNYALALKSDGTVAAWNPSGQSSDVPAGINNAVAIAAGGNTRMALKADGSVVVWGEGPQPPAGLPGLVAIAADHSHCLGLKADGTVVAWGGNGNSQLNIPAGLSNVVTIAAGGFMSYALKADGSVIGWGNFNTSLPPALQSITSAIAISAAYHVLVLRDASGDAAPAITAQPVNRTIAAGSDTTFSIAASGGPTPIYQWQRQLAGTSGFVALSSSGIFGGVTTPTLAITGATLAMNGDQYRCVATNSFGTTTSNAAVLTVTQAPQFTSASSVTFSPGALNFFTVTASGSPVPTFSVIGGTFPVWAQLNATTGVISGTPPDATGSPFSFTLQAANGTGTTTQAFTVTVALPNRLNYLAVRMNVPAEGITSMFTIDGTGTKTVLMRGVGPALAAFGVPGTMTNPELALSHASTGTALAANDDWNSSDASTFAQVGAFSYAAGSRDAAIVANLAPGTYTVRLGGVGGITGEALLEIYDAGGSSSAKFSYLSQKGPIAAGDTRLVGFTLAGSSSQPLLIRGVGPSLDALGTVPDPNLVLSSPGAFIASNDNWGGSSALANTASMVGAFPFMSSTSKDSAVLATIAPGNYTAQVSMTGSGGIALVEIYDAGTPATGNLPYMITSPVGQSVTVGSNVTFTAVAAGPGPLVYQWRKNGTAIAGANSAALVLSNVQAAAAATYDVVVSNSVGSTTSSPVGLMVSLGNPPIITSHPQGGVVTVGGLSNFVVTASSTTSLTYQWRFNGVPIAGAGGSGYGFTNTQLSQAGNYDVVVTNAAGSVTSQVAVLTVVPPTPPAIITPPASATQFVGGNVSFSVTVSGTSPFSYQWRKGGANIAGATNSSLALSNVQPVDAGSYDVVVSNAAGTAFSPPATLTVTPITLPVITTQPIGGTLNVTNAGSFRVVATGSATFSYQWRKNGVPIAGATGSTYLLGQVTTSHAGTYDVVVTNSVGSVTSSPAVLVVNPASVTITAQPVAIATFVGETATLSVTATGVPGAPTFQWRRNGVAIPGATSSSLTFASVQLADAGNYDVVVANSFASVTSVTVALTIGDTAPQILTPPVGGTLAVGGSATLSVTAVGSAPLAYQWYRQGIAIGGATASTFAITNAQTFQSGDYTVSVTNGLGTVTSVIARINVVPRVVTYSARLTLDAAGALGLFTIEGTAPKKLLLRAVGPGLAPFGIAGLADPQLELFDAAGNLIALNNDWNESADAAAISSTTAAVGAFALGVDSRDAAILRTLAPGTYTVRARPASGVGGTGYLELFDADLATGPLSTLPYVAVRGRMAPGAGVVIGGLGSNGRGQRSYLVRAIGPALGLAGVLANPSMLVVRDGTLVGSNDDWDSNPADATATATATTRVGTFPLSAGAADAALVLTGNLHVGSATVQIGSADTAGGTVLLELHDLDATRPTEFAPSVVSPPVGATLPIGESVTLRVVAGGSGPLTYQWRKDGTPIAGATGATLALPFVQLTHGGSYSVVVTNALGSMTSLPAVVTVHGAGSGASATHALVGNGYGGGTVTITNTLTYAVAPTSLGWSVVLPPGWSFASNAGMIGDIKPPVGTTGTLEWAWSEPPADFVTFTYTVNVPAGTTGDQALSASGIVRSGGTVEQPGATPGPLMIPRFVRHSADTDSNFRVSLLELTRVIELYNTRNGTNRTGCYKVQDDSEDGFAAEPTRAASTAVGLPRYHSADSNRDGKISLLELTRVIELYNYRVGTTRTGQYHLELGTEDGFASGP